jgi:hypothetical protein
MAALFFFALDLLRLSDVFIGQFSQRRLRHNVAHRHIVSERPAFGGLFSQIDGAWGHGTIRFQGGLLLYPILRRVRERTFVILNPNQIARVEIAAARLASEIMISLGNAPPVGALAEHRPTRPRFIDRHDRPISSALGTATALYFPWSRGNACQTLVERDAGSGWTAPGWQGLFHVAGRIGAAMCSAC